MKILGMCSAGMSTGLLESHAGAYDIFLLAPQVQYKEEWVKKIFGKRGNAIMENFRGYREVQ